MRRKKTSHFTAKTAANNFTRTKIILNFTYIECEIMKILFPFSLFIYNKVTLQIEYIRFFNCEILSVFFSLDSISTAAKFLWPMWIMQKLFVLFHRCFSSLFHLWHILEFIHIFFLLTQHNGEWTDDAILLAVLNQKPTNSLYWKKWIEWSWKNADRKIIPQHVFHFKIRIFPPLFLTRSIANITT